MSADPVSVDTARTVAVGLAKIGLALRHHAWEERERTGLTPTQAQIVALLGSRGALRIGEVARLLAVSQPTVSDALAVLVAKGLVARRPAAADRRVQLVELTDRGQEAARSTAEWPDALLAAVDALEPGDQAAFLRGLSSMILELQRRGQIPVQRMCATCGFFRQNAHDDPLRPHHCAFVDAPFGDRELRLDCRDHQPTTAKEAA